MKKGEIWKDVIGYEKYYQVSNTGKVRSKNMKCWNGRAWFDKKGKELSQNSDNIGKGYLFVNMGKGKGVTKVHRLVAEHFVNGQKQGLEVNHIDGNTKNNNAENLEWITHKENCQHWVKLNGVHKANYKPKKIINIDLNLEFNSISDAKRWVEQNTKFKNASTSNFKRNTLKGNKTYGYKWKYKEEKNE